MVRVAARRTGLLRLWPVPLIVGVSVVVQQVSFSNRYDVAGHAAEHLGGASAPFFAFAVIATLLYVTPAVRRRPAVVLACLAWFVSTVFVLVGNVRVVDALIDAGLERVSTDDLVVEGPIADAHDLADAAPWYGVLTSLAVVAALWRCGHLSRRAAIGAAVASVIVPPWVIPGGGMVVVVVARSIAFWREPQE